MKLGKGLYEQMKESSIYIYDGNFDEKRIEELLNEIAEIGYATNSKVEKVNRIQIIQ